MKNRGQAQRHFFRHRGEIVHHHQRVIENVFVKVALVFFHAFERDKLRKDDGQHARLIQQAKANRRFGRRENFEKLLGDAFLRNNAQPLTHVVHAGKSFFFNFKIKLRRKTNCAHDSQRIVAERRRRLERRAQNFCLQVCLPIKRIDECAEISGIQSERHRVDREIAP